MLLPLRIVSLLFTCVSYHHQSGSRERLVRDLARSVPAAEKAGDRPNMTSLLARRPRFLQGLGE